MYLFCIYFVQIQKIRTNRVYNIVKKDNIGLYKMYLFFVFSMCKFFKKKFIIIPSKLLQKYS